MSAHPSALDATVLELDEGDAALPAPGGRDGLAERASELFSKRLDRCRPLPRMAIVAGLAEDRHPPVPLARDRRDG